VSIQSIDMNKPLRILIVGLSAVISGCATSLSVPDDSPMQALQSVEQFMESKRLTDARYQKVDGREYLKVNLALRHQLDGFEQRQGLAAKQHFVNTVLEDAWRVGMDAMTLYFQHLSPSEKQNLLANYPQWKKQWDGKLEHLQAALVSGYRNTAQQQLQNELAKVAGLKNENDIDDYWADFINHIEESIMTDGRLTRQIMTAPLVPIIKSWIAYHEMIDYRGSHEAIFEHQDVFYPLADNKAPTDISAEDWRLLHRFAPVLVQQRNPEAKYPQRADAFGAVSLRGQSLENVVPIVDIEQPTVYAYIDEKTIQGVKIKQLVYTFWYTEHPQLSRIDFEAGPMEGWTFRVSLNQANQPMLFESVSNCGCYYKVFPTDHLETMSHQAYGSKLADKNFFVENHLEDRYDAVVPEVISGINAEQQSYALYYSAAHHQLLTISPVDKINTSATTTTRRYSLHSYAELENLPFQEERLSLFDTDGLVRGAHRLESTVLTPSGLYHAGHPRQRETQMIYFDEAEFDDPGLLETYLRLPPKAFASPTAIRQSIEN